MKDNPWRTAIIQVLKEEQKPLHTSDIAQMIVERGYRKKYGATPNQTVSTTITEDINKNKEKSIFFKVDSGIYNLRENYSADFSISAKDSIQLERTESIRVINAYGIYWNRNLIHWKTNPDIFGVQLTGAVKVNFKDQIGIYLLHDSRETIYVGQAIQQTLGKRLSDHQKDRLCGRWDRFSWFGFYPVKDTGKLDIHFKFENMTNVQMGNLLEAILIESIEPRQNRKQGNFFANLEYLQVESPELEKKRKEAWFQEIQKNAFPQTSTLNK